MCLLIALLLCSGCVMCRGSSLDEIWQHWKLEHNKNYATLSEEEDRKEIWQESYYRIAYHNNAQNKFFLALNQFSDMVITQSYCRSVITATLIFLCRRMKSIRTGI